MESVIFENAGFDCPTGPSACGSMGIGLRMAVIEGHASAGEWQSRPVDQRCSNGAGATEVGPKRSLGDAHIKHHRVCIEHPSAFPFSPGTTWDETIAYPDPN